MGKNGYKPYVYKRAEDLGIPVLEGKERVFLAVTKDDVVNAKKKNSEHCALARAALRIPGVNAAFVFRKTAFLEYDDKMLRFHLPHSTQKEIVSFDRAQIFAEGVYQLTPPAPSATRKGKNASDRARRSGKTKPKPAPRPITVRERAGLTEAIAKIAETEPQAADTPEHRQFAALLGSKAKQTADKTRHAGRRSVTGIKSSKAPEPLPGKAPTRYVHRTQYIRDLREPSS